MKDADLAQVADLMSYSVQTVEADARITDLIQRIRRIGHEGYPVVDNGQIVGLLTLRDADKTLEHGLHDATVRDVMLGGTITLRPNDPVWLLATTMAGSDWGQIPIVDEQKRLIGIVTRTDLIKFWAQTYLAAPMISPQLDITLAQRILGTEHIMLIERIAQFAQEQGILLYMVGGVVRDLILERGNSDIDFVVEGNAITFAENISKVYGGHTHAYKPFGTARWTLDETTAEKFGVPLASLPDHSDFATTRSELYEHPTALPTVYNSSIKLDLRRRDFTINTLAVQLSPKQVMWRILDFYGGLADIEQRLIRVLHSLSFVDDPTRILRAVRFSERLQFALEPRTMELMQTALPMLRRITGERIRNELELLLIEPAPVNGLLKLEALGVLKNIHPDFSVKSAIRKAFETLENSHPQWANDKTLLRWHLVLAQSPVENIPDITQRLLFGQTHANDFLITANLLQQIDKLAHPLTKPSEVDALLSPSSAESLVALWILVDDAAIRERIETYYHQWQHIKPTVTGHDLLERGLKQGREYRVILQRLRDEWLNGDIRNTDDEQLALKRLINEVYHDSK
jgi:tRNA nucleotidyltransferase (CCA-adding enzyme)